MKRRAEGKVTHVANQGKVERKGGTYGSEMGRGSRAQDVKQQRGESPTSTAYHMCYAMRRARVNNNTM